MRQLLTLLILSVSIAVVLDVPTALLTMLTFVVAISFVSHFNNNLLYPKSTRIYGILYVLNVAYMLLCALFMEVNGYNYLLAYDTMNVFIPNTEDFLNSTNTLREALEGVWKEYTLFSRFQAGYYTILVFWGYIAQWCGANLYFCLQLGGMTVTSIISVLIYKILKNNDINDLVAFKYSLIISVSSILFYYNTLILRDGIIALLFVYIMYLYHKDFSIINLIKMILVCGVMITFRVETGLASFLFIVTYFMYTKKRLNFKTVLAILCVLFIFCIAIFFVLQNQSTLINIYDNNYEYYSQDVDEGQGVIGALQRLPFPFGAMLSIVYTALMPVPFWTKLTAVFDPSRPECYNIMNFPMVIAAFFNTLVVSSLLIMLFKQNKPTLPKVMKSLLLPVVVVLLLQSAVVEQRRVMAMYVLFYIIWAIYVSRSQNNIQKRLLLFGVLAFIILQFIGLLFF